MTYRETVAVFALLATAYPKDPVTEEQMQLYHQFFAPWPADQVGAAVRAHIATSPYFPRISDIVGRIAEASAPTADMAWHEVADQIRQVGFYGRPTWSHALIRDTVQRLGWATLCLSEQPDVVRGQFRAFYEAARTRYRDRVAAEGPTAAAGALEAVGDRTPGQPEALDAVLQRLLTPAKGE